MFKKIQSNLAEKLAIPEDEIRMESRFNEDLGADSLDLFELVMDLEDEFGIEISTDDLEQLKTVGDVVNYLADRGIGA